MIEFARLFGIRLLLVFVVFGCVLNLANTNQSVLTPADLGFVSTERSFAAAPLPGESVNAELARLQEESGLSLILVADGAVQVILFSRSLLVKSNGLPVKAKSLPDGAGLGEISPDGTEVAFAVRPRPSGPPWNLSDKWKRASRIPKPPVPEGEG